MFTHEQRRVITLLSKLGKRDNYVSNIINQGWCTSKQAKTLKRKLDQAITNEHIQRESHNINRIIKP
jgi:vacuolar-type H+-ATPase subunit I/STV1